MIKRTQVAALSLDRRSIAAAILILFQFLATLPLLCGCGGPSVDTISVVGTVEIDGAPVPKGYVTFCPIAKGPAVSGEIKDGKFRCDVPAGTSRLTLIAQAAELREMIEVATGITRMVPQELLPTRYLQGFVVDLSPEAAAASENPEITVTHTSGKCNITIRLVSEEVDSG